MNNSFGRVLVCVTLLSGAMPAGATSVNWAFGEYAEISPSGVGNPPNSTASYTSMYNPAGGYFGLPNAGINSSLTDPTSSLTYSPNPAAASGGLPGAAINLSAQSSAVDVSGSLASGAIHMYAQTIDANVGGIETNAAASAEILELLTFSVAGGGSANVTFGLSLDGALSSSIGLNYSMLVQENFGNAFVYYDAGSGGPPANTSPTTGWNSALFTSTSLTGFNFTGTLTVTNGETVPITFLESLTCNNSTTCDYSNTTQMSLNLPSGTTFTSASGVFLTQTSSATPEPCSLMLVGLGISGVVCIPRRRPIR